MDHLSLVLYLLAVMVPRLPVSSSWTFELEPRTSLQLSRRTLGWKAASLVSAFSPFPTAHPAWAVGEGRGLLSTDEVADILHVVPTFTIVDAQGVPFMVVGEDAKVTGYFFATYGEAHRILRLARTSADRASRRDGPPTRNPWTEARISTVPLDLAVALAAKSVPTRSHFQVAPAESDARDALRLTGKSELAEGKVPLFYLEDFTVDVGGEKRRTPLYFRKSELVADYRRAERGKELPPILVTELFAVLRELVQSGNTDDDLRNLVLIPPKGSAQRAKQCQREGGKEPPFVLGKRNLVL